MGLRRHRFVSCCLLFCTHANLQVYEKHCMQCQERRLGNKSQVCSSASVLLGLARPDICEELIQTKRICLGCIPFELDRSTATSTSRAVVHALEALHTLCIAQSWLINSSSVQMFELIRLSFLRSP